MVNSLSLGNKTNVYDKNLSNSFVQSPSIYDSNFDTSLFLESNLSFPALNMYQTDFFADLAIFDMYLNNQMPLLMQQQLFTNFYNTKTNLKALKDVYNPKLANNFANIAEKNARRTNTIGRCAGGTNDAIEIAGLANGETRVASAYQAANKLRNHKNFKEVAVSRQDLNKLPAGCVIVWQASPGHPHGHIAVTLGDGREASDHVQNIKVNRPAGFSVFVPVGNKKTNYSA